MKSNSEKIKELVDKILNDFQELGEVSSKSSKKDKMSVGTVFAIFSTANETIATGLIGNQIVVDGLVSALKEEHMAKPKPRYGENMISSEVEDVIKKLKEDYKDLK